MRRFVFAFLALGACSNDSPTCPDGGTCTDAAVEAGPSYSNFNVSVTGVVLDPGDAYKLVVTLDGNSSTTGPNIDVTIDGLPQGVTADPLTIFPGSPGGKVTLNAAANAAVPQDMDATVKATPQGFPALTAPLHVRVGSVFHVATQSESFQVPANVSTIAFTAWGAGGGAGGGPGGIGGGGGFATSIVSVTGGETLQIVVGPGGTPGGALPPWSGGVGGGYSAVLRGTDVLVMAGGGGGGGGTGFDAILDAGGAPGTAGGGGGGYAGENGVGACGGGGGTDAGGGASGGPSAEAGASLFGGGGAAPNGGGGGSGYFGGGGGGVQDASAGFGCGGGGGSAFATLTGSASKLLAATGAIPGGNTMIGYGDSGAAVGGGLGDAGQPFPGAAGLVVAAYPK
jgi:hypothetical protein